MMAGSETASAAIVAGMIGFIVLAGLVLLRGLTGGRVEVKLADAAIAIIPVVLVLLATGQIQKLAIGTEGITIETTREAILKASATSISGQVSPLPVAPIEIAGKGGVGEIPGLIARGVQALEFRLGAGFYVGQAIEEFLKQLTQHPAFRFVVVTNPDGTLFGVMDARKLAQVLALRTVGIGWNEFADILNRNDAAAFGKLGPATGFVPRAQAVTKTADKHDALERMEKLAADWLPVVDERGRFAGVVDRSRLTASLILDVTTRLQQAK
jgi:CBS domain-containing protein